MQAPLAKPNVTPILGVLLVMFLLVAATLVPSEMGMLESWMPDRWSTCCGCDETKAPDAPSALELRLRADLSVEVNQRVIAADEVLRTLARYAPERRAIYMRVDAEVRWGDLVSTLDSVRGVAPDAWISLLTDAELDEQ